MSNNLIITIGRECGSGGRHIGKKLAEELGIKCYDKELIDVAVKTGYIEERDRDALIRFRSNPSDESWIGELK